MCRRSSRFRSVGFVRATAAMVDRKRLKVVSSSKTSRQQQRHNAILLINQSLASQRKTFSKIEQTRIYANHDFHLIFFQRQQQSVLYVLVTAHFTSGQSFLTYAV